MRTLILLNFSDELDSYMFQTVGHEAVEMFAEATGLPLYRAVTSGQRKGCGLHYQPEDGDEVEDLYDLLQRVKEEEVGLEGVASGAVLSDYQRLRVENVWVCARVCVCVVCVYVYMWGVHVHCVCV